MLNMVLKGTICFRCPETPPTFTLILDLDVDLILNRPTGLNVIDMATPVAAASGFDVLNVPDVVDVPESFLVGETDLPPDTPLGLHLENTDYVTIPQGLLVEDI